MARAALYFRVSTDRQTVENQVADLRLLAAARGFEPVVYEEVESAAKARPVFALMMADARAGRISAIMVWALDRMHRSMLGAIQDVLELDRIGVPVISVREPWLDTGGPVRQLLVAVFGWVAEQERTRLIERTKAGIERARAKGTKSGKPIGRPPASPILLRAAAEIVEAGSSIRGAAREKGLKPSTLRRFMRQNPRLGAPTGGRGTASTSA